MSGRRGRSAEWPPVWLTSDSSAMHAPQRTCRQQAHIAVAALFTLLNC